MRTAFLRELARLAVEDERIVFLTGDLGYLAVEPLAAQIGARFVNVGVAEQNMIAMATGLAEAGLRPFVYSIATFATLRAYEMIRNGPIAHRLPVRIVGVGGGFEYGANGPTHHALEDIAVMRAQPGISIVAPADAGQARTALRSTVDLDGPVYYRLGKNDNAVVAGLEGRFEIGRVQVVRSGRDVALVALGAAAVEAVAAADLLAADGVEATVAVVASVRPEPYDDLAALLASTPLTVTVEAHYRAGGLGSLCAEVVAERGLTGRLVRLAVDEVQTGVTGSQAYHDHRSGISAAAIAARAGALLGRV